MKVYPVKGRLVRCPATGREVSDPAGTEIPDNDPFWIRRIADGDVSLTATAASATIQASDATPSAAAAAAAPQAPEGAQ